MICGINPLMMGGQNLPQSGFVAWSDAPQVSSSTTITVPIPTGAIAGDMVYLFVYITLTGRSYSSNTQGFSLDFQDTAGNGSLIVLKKQLTGSEGAVVVTVSSSSTMRAIAVAYRGVGSAAAGEEAGTRNKPTSGTAVSAGAPSFDNAKFLTTALLFTAAEAAVDITPGSGLVLRAGSNAATSMYVMDQYLGVTTPTTVTTKTATLSASAAHTDVQIVFYGP